MRAAQIALGSWTLLTHLIGGARMMNVLRTMSGDAGSFDFAEDKAFNNLEVSGSYANLQLSNGWNATSLAQGASVCAR